MTMQQPPPMPLQRINAQDEVHLGLISVFHFVLAGLYLLGIGFVILHFMIMSMVFRMAETQAQKSPPTVVAVAPEPLVTEDIPAELEEFPALPPPAAAPPLSPAPAPFPKEIIPFFIAMYVAIGLFLVALGTANVLSGLFIRKRKNRTFSFIVAGINCMQVPFGTALGVFTFIVLSRLSVKAEYDANLPG